MLDETLNTECEAFEFTRRFGENNLVILSTSASHIRRAVFWFKEYKQNVIPAPANYLYRSEYKSFIDEWGPSQSKYQMVDFFMDEIVGLILGKISRSFN